MQGFVRFIGKNSSTLRLNAQSQRQSIDAISAALVMNEGFNSESLRFANFTFVECRLFQCGQMSTEDLACRVVGSIPVGVSNKVCVEILGQMAERFKAAVY